jgi:hypothetical protein
MNFGEAIAAMRLGFRVTRTGWNGPGMWIALAVPDTASLMTLPFLYLRTTQGHLVPWLASQTDMLAEDWERV